MPLIGLGVTRRAGVIRARVGSGRTRSSDGRGFSERVAAPTRLSRPGFQSWTEGSL